MIKYVAPTPNVTTLTEYIAPARVAPSPQFSITSVETSAPRVVGAFLHLEGSAVPVNLTYQEQIVAGETTQSVEKFHPVQEQVKIPKIPEVQIPERIQQQTVLERMVGDIPAPPIVDDTVEIQVTEWIHEQIGPERSEDQVGDIPVPPIVEETVEVVELFPESVDERIVDFPVPEIPIIVSSSHTALLNDCAAPVRDVAHATAALEVDVPIPVPEIPITVSSSHNALVNDCAAPVRDVAHATAALEVDVPMHNNVGPELIPTTLNPVGIPIPSSMLTISDDIAKNA